MTERPKKLAVGTRVKIVATEKLNSRWVSHEGEIIRFREPYDMAIVRISGTELREIFWVEELRAREEEQCKSKCIA